MKCRRLNTAKIARCLDSGSVERGRAQPRASSEATAAASLLKTGTFSPRGTRQTMRRVSSPTEAARVIASVKVSSVVS